MIDNNRYHALHETVRGVIGPREPNCRPLNSLEDRVFDLLMEVEKVRQAAAAMMLNEDSEVAADLLLCIATEARKVKLRRTPLADQDSLLFQECADDAGLYDFIHDWVISRPR